MSKIDQVSIKMSKKELVFLNSKGKDVFRLEPHEAEYIRDLIIRNQFIIRHTVKSVLNDKFDQIGDDCISEIYFLACKKISILKKHEKPDAWITVASRKVAQNMVRKYNTVLNKTADEEITDITSEDNVFEDALYNIWLEEGAIDKLLNTLTPHEREIYNLIYKNRLSSKEVAKIMAVSDSTIRNTVATIKLKIKKSIETKLF